MKLDKQSKYTDFLLSHQSKKQFWVFITIMIMLPSIYVLVLYTGGIKFVYSHTMYIPIIIAAVFFGYKGGILTAIIAGLLLGPLMPLETINLEPQSALNWLYRMLLFSIVGGFSGFVIDRVKHQCKRISALYMNNQETGLPTYNSYLATNDDTAIITHHSMVTVIINNYEDIIILIGREMYVKLIQDIYTKLATTFGTSQIMQVDNNKLWTVLDTIVFKSKMNEILEYFEEGIFVTQQVPMFVDISVGVRVLENSEETIIEGFRASEMAALYAKNHKLRYVVYEDKHKDSGKELKLLAALPLAIKHNQLFLEYHPLVNLKTGQVDAVEALVRWRHDNKLIAPLDFIPIAEKTKLIDQVTEWIVNRVIDDYKELTRHQKLRVNINISQRNLSNPALIEKIIMRIKAEKSLDLTLGIEVTESALMKNMETTKSFLNTLKDSNVTAALDDFGTGYSTLSILSELPVETIKVDRHLVFKMAKDQNAYNLVKIIIDYAHTLNIAVVSEGIENEKTENLLIACGCDYGQGFYYTVPLPLEDVVQWLIDRQKNTK